MWPEGKPIRTSPASYPTYDASDAKGSFMKICDMMIDEVVQELPWAYEMPGPEVEWVQKMLEYNVKGGKMNRGLMVVECCREIFTAKGLPIDNADMCRFAVLGWCVEWLQAWLLVADDVMDDSETRRGQPCWYKLPHVQKIALNDAFMIEMLVYKVLQRHFGDLDCYQQLLDLFLETSFQTECGQLLDTLCMNLTLEDFTLERWTQIVKYKTAFYSFYLSVALGMVMAGVENVQEYNGARDILMIMGIYFQAQDDFLDCFGTAEQIGKVGTDIQDKKCGWLFVNAYGMVNPQQKQLLQTHYGNCKAGSSEEAQIKALYKELKLEELYRQYEDESYQQIMKLKGTVKEVPWSVFDIFLHKVYKRSK